LRQPPCACHDRTDGARSGTRLRSLLGELIAKLPRERSGASVVAGEKENMLTCRRLHLHRNIMAVNVLIHNGTVNYYSDSMSGIGYARCDWFSEFRRVAMGELLKGKGRILFPRYKKISKLILSASCHTYLIRVI
jgi:hypothetical protein